MTIEEAYRKLAELEVLPQGWDRYRASPIDRRALQVVEEYLDRLREYDDATIPQIFPLTNGGVQLEWRIRGIEIDAWVDATGQTKLPSVCTFDRE